MSTYRRPFAPGATWFFTVVTHRRRPLLTRVEVRRALREAIAATRRRYPFTIDAWVLLPDHLHSVWTLPPDDAAIGERWSAIKRHVTCACPALALPRDQLRAEAAARVPSGSDASGTIWSATNGT